MGGVAIFFAGAAAMLVCYGVEAILDMQKSPFFLAIISTVILIVGAAFAVFS